MKIKTTFILFYISLYIFVTISLFLSAPFLVDFGSERNIILRVLSYMQCNPLNPVSQDLDVSLGKVLINGFVWTTTITITILIISKLGNYLLSKKTAENNV